MLFRKKIIRGHKTSVNHSIVSQTIVFESLFWLNSSKSWLRSHLKSKSPLCFSSAERFYYKGGVTDPPAEANLSWSVWHLRALLLFWKLTDAMAFNWFKDVISESAWHDGRFTVRTSLGDKSWESPTHGSSRVQKEEKIYKWKKMLTFNLCQYYLPTCSNRWKCCVWCH